MQLLSLIVSKIALSVVVLGVPTLHTTDSAILLVLPVQVGFKLYLNEISD